MNKIIFSLLLLLTASFSVCAQDVDNTPDPVASLRDQIQAASTPSDRIRLQLQLAELFVSTGHKTEALKELQLIANSGSFDPVGFYNLGNSFARIGETGAAIDAYRTAIEQRNGTYSRAYNNLGVLLLRSGRWDEAHDAFLSALKLENFRYAEASYNLGRVYAARGQKDLAAREWKRALYVNPQHDAARQALANVSTEEKIAVKSEPARPVPASKAEPESQKLTLDQASFNLLQRARDAAERGKMAEAADDYIRLLNRQGGYFPVANVELSHALISLKRYDEAINHLIQVSERDGPRYPTSYFHLGRLYELRGELKLAEAAFSQAAAAYSATNPQFHLDVSRVREKLGDFKGALESLELYLKLRGERPLWSDERLAELRRKAGQ
jgi:tetratricopeptide (TPR) repeat protein